MSARTMNVKYSCIFICEYRKKTDHKAAEKGCIYTEVLRHNTFFFCLIAFAMKRYVLDSFNFQYNNMQLHNLYSLLDLTIIM